MSDSTALVIAQENAMALPEHWFRSQIDTLKDLIAKDCSDQELDLFAKICKMRGLNPFSRQIYAVQLQGKMTVQVGIDGLRLIAQRSGEYEGQTPTQWCGDDGAWKEVWLDKSPPSAARVGVYRKSFREPIYGVAKFSSYSSDKSPTWKKLPEVMIAKCAESLALRKAFPQETEGLYTPEEMMQANEPPPDPRPVFDPPFGEINQKDFNRLNSRLWALANELTGGERTEERLYKFGASLGLIDTCPDKGRPSVKATAKSKIERLIGAIETKLASKPAKTEPPPEPSPVTDEAEDAEYTLAEQVDLATLKMQIELLEAELSGHDKIEKRGQWYLLEMEAFEDAMIAAYGSCPPDALGPTDKKGRPRWVEWRDDQFATWHEWLKQRKEDT